MDAHSFFVPQAMKSWAGPETEGSHVVSHLPQLPTSSYESHTDEIVTVDREIFAIKKLLGRRKLNTRIRTSLRNRQAAKIKRVKI